MANRDQLNTAREGSEAWNKWRASNPNADVDFIGVNFGTEQNKTISFKGFEFGESANFAGSRFPEGMTFEGAKFGHYANFEHATFGDAVNFNDASFGDHANFSHATFEGSARFQSAGFGTGCQFVDTTFKGRAHFEHSNFGFAAEFSVATFWNSAHFDDAAFEQDVSFIRTTFKSTVSFDAVGPDNRQAGLPPQANRRFDRIQFLRTRFGRRASFTYRVFTNSANFSGARFDEPPDFRGTVGRENLDWSGVQFRISGGDSFWRWLWRGWSAREQNISDLRRLRGIANTIHAVDAERDLFILERLAERGVLWHNAGNIGWGGSISGLWRLFRVTLLMGLYGLLSNFGRNAMFPILWFGIANTGAYVLYRAIIDKAWTPLREAALFDFAFASAIPFGATARPSFDAAVNVLFDDKATKVIDIPWQIQVVSVSQGIFNLILLFLFGLALRNYFKLR